jgi:hypothetical protein
VVVVVVEEEAMILDKDLLEHHLTLTNLDNLRQVATHSNTFPFIQFFVDFFFLFTWAL